MKKFYLKSRLRNGITVDAKFDYEDGKIILKTGSILNKLEYETISTNPAVISQLENCKKKRKEALEKGLLSENEEDGSLTVLEDITFTTPTAAGKFAVGKPIAGGNKLLEVGTDDYFDLAYRR